MTEYATKHLMPGDRSLRRDMRVMGWQLRRLVCAHGGAEVWKALRHVRILGEQRQSGDPHAEEQIIRAVHDMSTDQLASIVRAIGLFFDLANIAEDRHRVRVLHERAQEGRPSETIRLAIQELRQQGLSASEIRQIISQLEIEPVFTAHPTEAKRRSVRRVLRRLRRDLYLLDRPHLSGRARSRRLVRMQRDLLSLWSTDPSSARKPTVMDELRRALFAVRTLWRVGPQVMQELREAVDDPDSTEPLISPLKFGNWIGGDRDGNPFVTHEVTRATLLKLRATSIALHRRAALAVTRRLTMSASRCALPQSLLERVDAARERWPNLNARLDRYHPDEWIVHWLIIIDERLQHSKELPDESTHPMAYIGPDELTDDLDVIHHALRESGHNELIAGALMRWRDRVRMFGLHLLRLDVRVHSTKVRALTHELLEKTGQSDNYSTMDEADRQSVLAQADITRAAAIRSAQLTEENADLIETLRLIQRLSSAGDPDAFGTMIVSMTHVPSDIIALVWLLEVSAAGIGDKEPAAMPVAPLLETIDDLERGDGILEALLDNSTYQRHIKRCADRVTVMIGYSDSAKDGGYVASNWALYRAQARMAECANRHDVNLTVFHGRGGALGRGGGPAARAILSLPPQAVAGRLRLTEQGEVIAERYDDPAVAKRHLQQLFWATIRQSHREDTPVPDEALTFAQELADRSMASYRSLVDHPGFEAYLRQCTVLPLIESLRIGSRPSRRTSTSRVEDLRAIPFSFAWNQVRMPINAFFGLGAAFDSLDPQQRAKASDWYAQWPWFRAVIDNAELALARCDVAITRRYTMLSAEAEADASHEIWSLLRDEYEKARHAVLTIKNTPQILSAVPWLQRTIRVRNPYLDILNLIQVELMTRTKSSMSPTEESDLAAALRLSIQAIAAGLRNTG